jgi:phosphatidate cytidylyltransferase
MDDTTTPTLRRRRGNNTNDGPPMSSETNESSGAADESAGHQTSDHGSNSGGPIISLRTALTSEATRYLVRAPPTPSLPPSSSTALPSTTNNDEKQLHKFLMRTVSGLTMLSIFILILLAGHVYVCALVFILEVLLFRELVTVRFQAYYDRIDSTIPLFRTTQWLWFSVSLFYVYSEFAVDVLIKSNVNLHDNSHIVQYVQLAPVISFSLYTTTFVLTIATLQVGHIRFQLNQLCWTIVVLCLTVGQLKYIMHNVYNGLIWFTLPILLVISNDCFAYFSGVTCGRKFIHRPFMELSPNKTWEGFIGGGIGTVVFGWYCSRYMSSM